MLSLHGAPPDGTAAIACDDDGVAETTSSVIQQTLQPGTYYLVLKGKLASDQGQYLLTVRDVGAVPAVQEVDCDASGGTGDPAVVTFDAVPGKQYYALVKGDRPQDQGAFTLSVHDMGGDTPHRIACDGSSLLHRPDLDLDLAPGSYYIAVKGKGSGDAGGYTLEVGGASGTVERFLVPSYSQTLTELNEGGIRVASVLACQSGGACDAARGQDDLLAYQTDGTLRAASDAADVPKQIVKAVQVLESFDTVEAELEFAPDANPGFASIEVIALADPNNGCASADGARFRNCVPGAKPAFAVSMANPVLTPVAPSMGAYGAYRTTLHVRAERDGALISSADVPVLVVPTGFAPADTFTSGSYRQDIEAKRCKNNTRPSWDRLTLDADVRPDTSVGIYACAADTAEELAMCDAGGESSGYKSVGRISAGTGAGKPCTVATQQTDCPRGYCSPYTRVCNEVEGASCAADKECPGTAVGRCRVSPASLTMAKTCAVTDVKLDPSSALDGDNFRKFMRVRLQSGVAGRRIAHAIAVLLGGAILVPGRGMKLAIGQSARRAAFALALSSCAGLLGCGDEDSPGPYAPGGGASDAGERDGASALGDAGGYDHVIRAGDVDLCGFDERDRLELAGDPARGEVAIASDERGFSLVFHADDGALSSVDVPAGAAAGEPEPVAPGEDAIGAVAVASAGERVLLASVARTTPTWCCARACCGRRTTKR